MIHKSSPLCFDKFWSLLVRLTLHLCTLTMTSSLPIFSICKSPLTSDSWLTSMLLNGLDLCELFSNKPEINVIAGTMKEYGAIIRAYIKQACKGIVRWYTGSWCSLSPKNWKNWTKIKFRWWFFWAPIKQRIGQDWQNNSAQSVYWIENKKEEDMKMSIIMSFVGCFYGRGKYLTWLHSFAHLQRFLY